MFYHYLTNLQSVDIHVQMTTAYRRLHLLIGVKRYDTDAGFAEKSSTALDSIFENIASLISYIGLIVGAQVVVMHSFATSALIPVQCTMMRYI